MNHAQIKAILEGVIPEVKDAIALAQKPIVDRLTQLEAREPIKGKDGLDGVSPTLEDIEPLVAKAIAQIPPPKDGERGLDGKDGISVTLDDVAPLIERAVAAIPRPVDGKDGERGADGAPDVMARCLSPRTTLPIRSHRPLQCLRSRRRYIAILLYPVPRPAHEASRSSAMRAEQLSPRTKGAMREHRTQR